MGDEVESLNDQGAEQEVADAAAREAAPAVAHNYGPLTNVPQPARLDGESDQAFVARVQIHYGTERTPAPIKSLAQVRRLRELAEKDPKYTPARFDADLALTEVASLPERLHPKK